MDDMLQLFEGWYAAYGYPVLFLGVALENAGLPLPGETAVLIAAFLASPAGGALFRLEWVIAVAFVAAVCGDNMGYWVGRRLARPRLTRGRGFLLLTPERFARAEGFFARYGVATIFVARFIAALRVLAAPAAGAAGMHWPSFFLANALGALSWAVLIGLLGYFFGKSWAAIHHWLGWGAWIVLAAALLALVLWHLFKRRKEPSPRGTP
jgi:membrane-associated protein